MKMSDVLSENDMMCPKCGGFNTYLNEVYDNGIGDTDYDQICIDCNWEFVRKHVNYFGYFSSRITYEATAYPSKEVGK